MAMGSACELQCETILSFDLGFIAEAAQVQPLATPIEIKRMLGGLIPRCLPLSIERDALRVRIARVLEPLMRSWAARPMDLEQCLATSRCVSVTERQPDSVAEALADS